MTTHWYPMRERELHPHDPRNNPNFREHGKRRWPHTWEDIAAVLKCSEKRAQNMAALKLFDPRSLVSIVDFRDKRLARKGSRR